MKNMRKLIAAILVAVCLCACVAAAETVQSPTKPVAVVEQIATTVPAPEGAEPFIVEPVETELWSETAVQVFEEITLALADPEVAPVSIFTEEEMATAAALLPVEYDASALTIAEYIPMNIINYVPELGDAAVQFVLPGEYTEEDVVIAMFKPFNGDESTWVALEAKVVVAEETEAAAETTEAAEAVEITSNIEVLFTQAVLEALTANEGALLILRG
ncbi:MAG: hypothetical protein IJO98_01365 [Clostridia bacterium]|nr:hypothetical protein [Clostridia bacterium]